LSVLWELPQAESDIATAVAMVASVSEGSDGRFIR